MCTCVCDCLLNVILGFVCMCCNSVVYCTHASQPSAPYSQGHVLCVQYLRIVLYSIAQWNLDNPTLCGQQVTFSIQRNLDNPTLCGQQVTFSIQWNLDNPTLCGQQVTFSIQWNLDNPTLCGQQVTFSIQWNLDNLTLCGQQVTFSIQWNLYNLTLCGQQNHVRLGGCWITE